MADLLCPLREWAKRAPESPALVEATGSISYGELDRRVAAAAIGLKKTGCREGERIALLLPTGRGALILILAVLRIKAIACLINTRLPLQAIRSQLKSVLCGRLIAHPNPAIRKGLPDISIHAPDGILHPAVPDPGPATEERLDADQPATLMFTSGSQGWPKAVLHSYGNHWYNAMGANDNLSLGPGDRWLLTLPVYHVGGLGILFRCILSGGAVALPDPHIDINEDISRRGITHVSMVPTQLYRSLSSWKRCPPGPTLKGVLLGGAPIPQSLVEQGSRTGLPLMTSYGLTEMASQVTTTPPGAPIDRLSTAGKLLRHRRLRIDESGEILVQGETLCLGYIEGHQVIPVANREPWFPTGDLGEIDANGYLRVFGRRDNMFVTGGENVHPEEIERILCDIEGIEQAVVVSVPDDEFGSRPVAFIEALGTQINATALISEIRGRLPGYKVPVAFHPFPNAPDTGRLKPDRNSLKTTALKLRRKANSTRL